MASEDNVGTTFHLCLPEADFTEAERELAAPETRRRTLALVCAPGPGLDRTAQFLRKNGYYVAVTGSEEALLEMLRAAEADYDAVVLLATAKERAGVLKGRVGSDSTATFNYNGGFTALRRPKARRASP